MALFLLLIFSLLIVQFFRIQIVQHERWVKEANAQHTAVILEPFKRGLFYSNTDIKSSHPSSPQALVVDVPKFHLFVDPQNIPKQFHEIIIRELTIFLHLNEEEKNFALEQLIKNSRSRKVYSWIASDVKDQIFHWWLGFAKSNKLARNALFFVQDYQRNYPYGKFLGQVLHTVREQREEETLQAIPTGGLELMLNEALQGKPGKRLFFRSPRHAMDMGKIIKAPEDGADIYLTVNHVLQAIAEEEIEKHVLQAEAKRGWAIMMDPFTGEILALAQYPFFYPKEYRQFFNDKDRLEDTKVRAITDPYEPGSTMKPITMAICMLANEELKKRGESLLFDPNAKCETLPCFFPGRLKPIKDLRNHRFLNMDMAIQKSSNVYMAKMVQKVIERLGVDWYRNTLQDVFGFGIKTGIELPAESPGLLPTPGKLHPNGTLEWSLPTPYCIAMGHNILVNSMQMLRCFGIIINGGYEVKPTLIKKIIKRFPDNNKKVLFDLEEHKKHRKPKQLLSEKISKRLIQSMKYVTKPGGVAPKGDIFGYSDGGKTSTSEKIVNGKYSKEDHISTFIGFAPADHPRLLLMVVIDEPACKFIPGIGKNQMGGNCAAPCFRSIGLKALQFLGIEPDDPFGYPFGDPRRNSQGDWLKEAEILRKLYCEWNE